MSAGVSPSGCDERESASLLKVSHVTALGISFTSFVQEFNDNPDVHGILVQLPVRKAPAAPFICSPAPAAVLSCHMSKPLFLCSQLPKHVNEFEVLNQISMDKDVDGTPPLELFSPASLRRSCGRSFCAVQCADDPGPSAGSTTLRRVRAGEHGAALDEGPRGSVRAVHAQGACFPACGAGDPQPPC